MWTHDYSLTTVVAPETLWKLLADVEGWVQWNDGIASIELEGPVAVGATFRMTPPGEDTIISTVVDLQPGRLLTDLTEMDGLAIKVEHRLDPQPGGGTTVTYGVEVTGEVPDDVAEEVGKSISADFPDVLASLVAAARARGSR
jgi:uncharacterized protein YndB with AHSA1/START domain